MKRALLSLLLMSSTITFAAKPRTMYWDNQEGLKDAKNCKILPLKVAETSLAVSSYTGRSRELIEKFRDKYHNHQTHLIVGSIINLEKGKNKRGYPKVRVIGVNNHRTVKANRYFTKRNDKGYIHKSSIRSIENAIFELRSNTPTSSIISMRGKFAAPLMIDGSLQKYDCKGSNEVYTIFGLYKKGETQQPEALIGMSNNETKLLRSIRHYSLTKGKEMIPALEQEFELDEFLGNTHDIEEEVEVAQPEPKKEKITVTPPPRPVAKPQRVATTTDKIICVNEGSLANVRDENLRGKFKAGLDEKVKLYVGFDSEAKVKRIGGKNHKFIEVQFPNNENKRKKSGWIAESLVKSPKNCAPSLAKKARKKNNKNSGSLKISSLNSKDCCEFPVRGKPKANYYSQGHQSNFAWRRSKGRRAHAGVDLYRNLREPVYAVAPGKVIRFAYFYDGTYQVTARHTGGFVVRYGEVASKGAKREGSRLKNGDSVGRIGKLQSCCSPMLHFELYSGSRKGSLTNKGNRSYPLLPKKWRRKNFQRRADLLDPTPHMRKWQRNSPFNVL